MPVFEPKSKLELFLDHVHADPALRSRFMEDFGSLGEEARAQMLRWLKEMSEFKPARRSLSQSPALPSRGFMREAGKGAEAHFRYRRK